MTRPLRSRLRRALVGQVHLLLGGALLGLLAWLYLWQCRQRAGVWLAAPLDDTFIHLRYAAQLARGRLLQFNDGDPPTTGATSLLYLFLLAPGWLLGLRGTNLLAWCWVLNGGLHLAGAVALRRAVGALTGQRALATVAMITFLGWGPLLWGVFSGMEIALLSSMLLLTLSAAVDLELQGASGGGPGGAGPARLDPRGRLLLWGSLLALCRPEGALLAGGLSLWLLWRRRVERRAIPGAAPLAAEGRQQALDLLPLGSGAGMVLLFTLLTGRLATNAAVKSHLNLLPADPERYLDTSLRWLPMTAQILLQQWPGPLVAPLTLLLLVGLGGWAAERRARGAGAGALALLWLVLLTLFYALVMARRDHHDRYYLPYLGLAVVATFWALGKIAALLPALRRAPVVVACLLLPFLAPQTLAWSRTFGDNCRDLALQHFRVARWLSTRTPPAARVLVNDAGAIPYLSGRYTYDLVGLAHDAFYRLKNLMPPGNAPVWEALEALPHRPEYAAAYPEWIPDLHRLPLFEAAARFPLQGRTMVANDVKVVWRLRWERVADSALPDVPGPPGARVVDRLDVAHLADEEAHGYRLLDPGPWRGIVEQRRVGAQALIDGGRLVTRGERFTLRARPRQPATLALRSTGSGALDLAVEVDGVALAPWRAPRRPGLSTYTLPIPAGRVGGDRLQITVRARRPQHSYHYWLLQ